MLLESGDGDANSDMSATDHKGTEEGERLWREREEAEQQEKKHIKRETEDAN